jgi:hypothetical protein
MAGVNSKNLPVTGRWQREALTEGCCLSTLARFGAVTPLHHDCVAVPLPVPGRYLV